MRVCLVCRNYRENGKGKGICLITKQEVYMPANEGRFCDFFKGYDYDPIQEAVRKVRKKATSNSYIRRQNRGGMS